ncbi:MAG TPA: hypothetical protein VL221_09310 [Bacteroidota bacterium]|nr:hypothetical protein [Bacteroidota bacterium]
MSVLRGVLLLACAWSLLRAPARSQCAPVAPDSGAVSRSSPPPVPAHERAPAILRVISPLIVPKIFQDCYLLREYVTSGELSAARHAYGDLYAVDCVFERAMRLCWDNPYEALLVCAFALMDHERFGVRLPVGGIVLWFPLTSELRGEFIARVDSLPSRLYADTPPEGDRDKLQHFFGSAFITAITESAARADLVGLFVEWGEELCIVGGVNDARDVRANRQGQRFALDLLAQGDARPSRYLTTEFPPAPDPSVLAPADSVR